MRFNTPPRSEMDDLADEGEFLDENDEVISLDDNIDDVNDEFMESNRDDDDEENDDENLFTLPEHDDSILTFKKHTGPVFCCSIHPHKNICATGGEDDKAYIWDISNGDVLHEITNHKDTVIAAYFSYDGNYLATGDMAGELQVFKIANDFKKFGNFQWVICAGLNGIMQLMY